MSTRSLQNRLCTVAALVLTALLILATLPQAGTAAPTVASLPTNPKRIHESAEAHSFIRSPSVDSSPGATARVSAALHSDIVTATGSAEEAEASLQSPIVRPDPANSTVEAGSTFTVTIMIDEAVDLGAFQFDLYYTPSIVQVEAITLGDFLASTGRMVGRVSRIDNSTGFASFGGYSFSFGTQPGPNGSGPLALIRLRAVGVGTSLLDLKEVQVFTTQSNPSVPTVEDGSVTVKGEYEIYLPLVLRNDHAQP